MSSSGGGAGAGGSFGFSGGTNRNDSLVDYFGSDVLKKMLQGSADDYMNSGAMSDMLLGGRGFGQSRRYRQYNPVDPDYGYQRQIIPGYNGPGGEGTPENPGRGVRPDPPGKPGVDMVATASGGEMPYSRATAGGDTGRPTGSTPPPAGSTPPPGSAPPTGYQTPDGWVDNSPPREGGAHPVGTVGHGTPGPMGPGQWDHGGIEGDKEFWDSLKRMEGPQSNQNWNRHDDAPVEGEGLLGDIDRYGEWSDLDRALADAFGWQSSGELSDLEQQEKWGWDKFGKQNQLERALEDSIGWQRSGALSDLEQQEKSAWGNLAGPGQYDELRGRTLTGMVEKPGLSASEASALRSSRLLPIGEALEAAKLEGDARQAATGNAAGRWGSSNRMRLDAAKQASQAGRETELDLANIMRQDRSEGLGGLGSLQGQIDARKAQGTQGLSNLAGRQRSAQQFGIQSGMGLNEQQRGAQAMANQGISGLGQRQRANQQWGLGGLSDLNKQKSEQELGRIGLTKDMWDSINSRGDAAADRAAKIGSLVAGGNSESGGSGWNAGVSV